jgi:hypothetical protein
VAHVILTCDMYKSSLRHIRDPVLSSLKMKGIFYYYYNFCLRETRRVRMQTKSETGQLLGHGDSPMVHLIFFFYLRVVYFLVLGCNNDLMLSASYVSILCCVF